MMRQSFFTVFAAIALAGCSFTTTTSVPTSSSTAHPQRSFSAINQMRVVPTSDPSQFVVLGRAGSAGPQYFCAAAQYADVMLGAAPSDRVVVTGPQGTAGGQNVRFALAPRGTVEDTGSVSIRVNEKGENLRVAHARSLCERPRIGFFF